MSFTRTDHNPAAELADLIDTLTRPHEVKIVEQGTFRGTRTQQPLLTKLYAARHSNIGTGSGAQTARHTRSVLNPRASELYAAIQRRTANWARRAGAPRPAGGWPDPARNLTAWHIATLADPHFNPDPHIATLKAWVDEIRDILDPPFRYTLRDSLGRPHPCPHCSERWAVIDIGGEHERIPALNVIDRSPDPDSVTICRSCGATWHGVTGAEELAATLHTAAIPVITPESCDA